MAPMWNQAGLAAPVCKLVNLLFSGDSQDLLTKMNPGSLRVLCITPHEINKYVNVKICMYIK